MTLTEFALGILDKKQYIEQVIIPAMDIRRGRSKPMTRDEILSKLHSLNPQKPGEDHEWAEAIRNSRNRNQVVTPELAGEIADLTYYAHQENTPPDIRGKIMLADWIIAGKIDLVCCIIKYSIRLGQGDYLNHSKKEYVALQEFLESSFFPPLFYAPTPETT